ncbi:MAG TPA: integration host factor subunit alpha [Nitrospiraceae bacterium]|nr:integration host factor subunit alpha [Nitrospiraceae bacterium]
MRKAEIAQRIHEQVGISQDQALELLEWIIGLFKATLQRGESIAINGFGRFHVRQKQARQGRNPRTGKPTTITARRVITFRPSSEFKAAVEAVGYDSDTR